jgi:spore germination protein
VQIHVVQLGQTLNGIAAAYNTSADQIWLANELQGLPYLVVGQALVIPIVGQFYWVQSGDTLYRLAQRFGTTPQELARLNRLDLQAQLPVGFRLYIPPVPRTTAEINAYVEPSGGEYSPIAMADVRRALPHLTYLAPFSFQVQRDGTLQEPALDALPQMARYQGVTPMLVVTNLEAGQFSDELGAIILNDEQVQDRLLDNIIATAKRYGFADIHFDLEFLPADGREAYNQFLRKAADRIHEAGYLISTALAPKTRAEQRGQWYEAHDYAAHGEIVDFVVLMTYEWGWSGGPPMAVSPLPNVRQVVDYAITVIPPEKIMLGQNLYGYDWTLPYVSGGPFARALSPQAATWLAAYRNVAIQYDWQAQAPFFTYVDDAGREHEVWFEDARSIQAKINLVKELGLRGISYWKLGLPFPQNWLLIADNFSVAKR